MSDRLIVRSPRKHPLCERCGLRWPQSSTRLCRRCEQEVGRPLPSTFDVEQARLQRRQARQVRLLREQPLPDDRRIVKIHGQEYFVIWDGSLDGAAARGLPYADERGE